MTAINIPAATYQRAREHAALADLTISEWLTRLVEAQPATSTETAAWVEAGMDDMGFASPTPHTTRTGQLVST